MGITQEYQFRALQCCIGNRRWLSMRAARWVAATAAEPLRPRMTTQNSASMAMETRWEQCISTARQIVQTSLCNLQGSVCHAMVADVSTAPATFGKDETKESIGLLININTPSQAKLAACHNAIR